MRELKTLGYDEVIESMEYELIAQANIGSYQGDYLYLLKNEKGKYAFTSLSYGSCSVCDYIEGLAREHGYDYQSPEALMELTEYRDGIHNGLTWISAKRMLWAVLDGVRRMSWYGTGSDYLNFCRAAINALADEADVSLLKELI